MNIDYTKQFSAKLIEEGLDLFQNDKVTKIERKENKIIAVVEADKTYEVEIELDDKEDVVNMKCTCLLGMNGEKCIHMVAACSEVDFQLSEYDEDEIEFLDEDDIEFDDFDDADEEIEFEEPSTDIKDIKMGTEKIDIAFKQYAEAEEDNAEKEAILVADILDVFGDIDALIYEDKNDIAVDMIIYLVTKLGNIDMEELGNGLVIVMADLSAAISDLSVEDVESTTKAFNWLLSEAEKNDDIDYLKEELINILFVYFDDKKYLLEKEKLVNKKIEELQNGDAEKKEYLLPEWENLKLHLENQLSE